MIHQSAEKTTPTEVAEVRQNTSRYDQEDIVATIKQTVCKGASDAQLRMFLEVCKHTGLDPFLKEIWFVAEKGIIMAGRDGYLRVANEHQMFDGIETRVERDDKMVPVKAVCTVWRKDRNHPTICEAYFNEYKAGGPVWSRYPSAMISKVAEVLALKRSFAINGVVSDVEMDATFTPDSGSREAQQEVVRAKLAGEMPMVSEERLIDLNFPRWNLPIVDPSIPGWQPPDGYVEQERPAKTSKSGKKLGATLIQIVQAFKPLKDRFQAIGKVEEYYGVLKAHGVEKSNGFADDDAGIAKARVCYKAMNLRVSEAEMFANACMVVQLPDAMERVMHEMVYTEKDGVKTFWKVIPNVDETDGPDRVWKKIQPSTEVGQ